MSSPMSNPIALTVAAILATGVVAFVFSSWRPKRKITKHATFGAGCYWGTEKYFKKDFGVKKFAGAGRVVNGQVGFMGPPGAKENPTYREVCDGVTQQVEVYDFDFDGDEKTYELLVRHFFMFHDPTTMHRQEDDIGFQYSSVIYVYDVVQREIAERVIQELQNLVNAGKVPYKHKQVVTEIAEATKFFPAHEEHQEYLDRNPTGYCTHRYRFAEWPLL